jgi:hypothetical protein
LKEIHILNANKKVKRIFEETENFNGIKFHNLLYKKKIKNDEIKNLENRTLIKADFFTENLKDLIIILLNFLIRLRFLLKTIKFIQRNKRIKKKG